MNISNKIDITSSFMWVVFSFMFVYLGYYRGINHAYVWSAMLFILGISQYSCYRFDDYVPTFRICCTWMAGIVWACLAVTALNMLLTVTCMLLSAINFYSFVKLIDLSNHDWHNFFQE